MATAPPIEQPTAPSGRTRAAASSSPRSIVFEKLSSGSGELPKPRMSNRSARYRSPSVAHWGSHMRRSQMPACSSAISRPSPFEMSYSSTSLTSASHVHKRCLAPCYCTREVALRDDAPAARPLRAGRPRGARRRARSSPSKVGEPPFSAIEPVLSPISAIVASSAATQDGRRRRGGQLLTLLLDRAGVRADLLDQRRCHQRTAGWASVQRARELQERQVVGLGDRPQPVELAATPVDPAGRPEGAVVALAKAVLARQVIVEQAAVVDHPRDHLHVSLDARGQRQ